MRKREGSLTYVNTKNMCREWKVAEMKELVSFRTGSVLPRLEAYPFSHAISISFSACTCSHEANLGGSQPQKNEYALQSCSFMSIISANTVHGIQNTACI